MDHADRIVIIGWDCASPWLLFDHWAQAVPNLAALGRRGIQTSLRSCHPPITVPAWMCMATGADAGAHGVYGFHCVDDSAPTPQLSLTTSRSFQGDRPVWERLARLGMRSRIIGLPGTFPTADPLIVPGILTPADHPVPGPGYRFDIDEFRYLSPRALIQEVTAMSQARFDYVERVAAKDDWNLLWVVEIGLDRLQHALWHHVDPNHPRYTGNQELADELQSYLNLLDRRLGRLIEQLDDGDTAFAVVSDHGARPMHGGIRINHWLMNAGHLTLHDVPAEPVPFDPDLVDWERTTAWTTGGYCARIYLRDDDHALAEQISHGISSICAPDGGTLNTVVLPAETAWPLRRGRAPDLLAYLGNLDYRCLGSLGEGPLHVPSNDRGPDAANHDWDGIFVAAGPGVGPDEPTRHLLEVAAFIERVLDARKPFC
jgi:predicted AlkP superfamily phosphohydrolase/phosphomutase